MSSWLKSIVRRPLFATLVTLLVIITGIAASLLTPEVRQSWPWGPDKWVMSVWAFYGLIVTTSLCYFWRDHVVAEDQRNAQEKLTELIRTLPPRHFLSHSAVLYGATENAFMATFREFHTLAPEKRDELVAQATRYVVQALAILAQKFDGDGTSRRYAANVMLFFPAEDMNEQQRRYMREVLVFSDETTSIENLRGVLSLEADLSSTATSKTAEVDSELRPFALPIPKRHYTETGYRVLPGAPLAFCARRADLYGDTHDLEGWCERSGDFTREVRQQVRRFFNDAKLRSFISVPLFPRDTDAETEPFGVLNVHCDAPNMLKGSNEAAANYVEVSRPFLILLVRLLALRSESKTA